MLEFDTDLTWLTFIDSLDLTGSSIKHGLSSLRIGVLQALGQKHESTDNTDDESLNNVGTKHLIDWIIYSNLLYLYRLSYLRHTHVNTEKLCMWQFKVSWQYMI